MEPGDGMVGGEGIAWGARIPRVRPKIPAPLCANFKRVVVETALVWIVLGLVVGAVNLHLPTPGHVYPRPLEIIEPLIWLWLFIWPAWRLERIVGRRWWIRLGKGLLRLWLMSLVLVTLVLLLAYFGLLTGPQRLVVGSPAEAVGTSLPFMFALMFFRAVVLFVAWGRAWTRSRLQRQLMVSHLAVIMITFVGLMAVGSLVALAVVVSIIPDARSQAQATAAAFTPRNSATALNRYRVRDVLDALQRGRVRPAEFAGTPLMLFIPWNALAVRIVVLDSKGTIIAASQTNDAGQHCPALTMTDPSMRAVWRGLVPGALAGKVTDTPVPARLACGGLAGTQRFAAAPIIGKGGRPVGVVVIQGQQLLGVINSSRLAGIVLTVFSAGTFVVIMITVLPTLGLSAIAAYLFARGLTRRLAAVSRAATAIATGDLTQRVPINATNEIGRLAQDFNRMAAHLETVMSDLLRARTQAEQALRTRQELVASVSHELRTPIAIVQAHLESLQGSGSVVARQGQEYRIPAVTVDALQSEMDRLAVLVEDLFSLARVETGALQVRREPTDAAALVREVAALLRPLAQQEGAITLTAETPPGLPLALADGDRLRQILANLVRNAVRHTPEGGIIALGVAYEDPWLVISVADTGEGIPAEHLPRIFERFYRVDQARTRAAGGAGLGLAIVREFVELMGGQVGVESVVGEGTIFRVFLPSLPIASPDALQQSRRAGQAVGAGRGEG